MLQKNVLDYLDSSAARFPHKLAFADEARSFTFGQLRACARGLGTALADLGPQHNRPVAVLFIAKTFLLLSVSEPSGLMST